MYQCLLEYLMHLYCWYHAMSYLPAPTVRICIVALLLKVEGCGYSSVLCIKVKIWDVSQQKFHQ